MFLKPSLVVIDKIIEIEREVLYQESWCKIFGCHYIVLWHKRLKGGTESNCFLPVYSWLEGKMQNDL